VTVLLALVGCHAFEQGYQPYYADRADPVFTAFDTAVETGNSGHRTVTITGSGFGTSVDDLVVQIGHHNAEILSVEDGAITISTPRGPVTGGAVDLLIATASGYVEVPGAYTYDVTLDPDTTTFAEEKAYIVAENLWTSCYGGMWTNPDLPGCEDIAYVGSTGLNGASEWFTASYPRIHTGQFGFVGSTDASLGAWSFDPNYDLSFPSADDLRRHVGEFTLHNPVWDDAGDVCIDPTVDPADNEVACDDPNAVNYDLNEVHYCEGVDPETGPDLFYQADWPVKQSFFQSDAEDPDAQFDPVDIDITIPAVSRDPSTPAGSADPNEHNALSATLRLPGQVRINGDEGFTDDSGVAWAVSAIDACPDAEGDGSANLDEDGIDLSWTPISETDDALRDGSSPGSGAEAITGVHTYIQASITYLPFGWFGLVTGAPRASIVVPDTNEIDDEGHAHVRIPNEILFQFPTPNPSWSAVNQFSHTGSLGTWDSNAAYLLIEVYRVTDYEIATPEFGTVVFSYVTGDLSFSDWHNPATDAEDSCHDCVDDDGDGWTDEHDPDCDTDHGGNGVDENGTNDDFTCADGIDNNGDGLVDRDDPLCLEGFDGESTCTDEDDNDLDGWVDAEDPDCSGDPNDQEDGLVVTGCSNGLDDDGDGWVDAGDPGCDDGRDDDEGGFGVGECNDGLDNDGHGDIDAADPYCADQGADAPLEAPVFTSQCADASDNDADGFTDGFDPDCELAPRTREYQAFYPADDEDFPVVPGCYDGIDNDGDGSIDGEDPSCWREDLGFRPDGFLGDEGFDAGTGCTDGLDEDVDGWVDGQDPDCVANDLTAQDEVGFGTTQCNDGIDNNGDGDIDSASAYCRTAEGNFEGP
jgi:hypothetical protein